MPTIDDFEVPEGVVKRMHGCIELLSDKDVLAYVRKHKDLAHGYQVTRKNARIFRTRIKRMLSGPEPLTPELTALLVQEGLNGDLIRLLSLDSLERLFTPLSTVLVCDEVRLGYLVDGRPEVRQLAIKAIESGLEPPERTDEAIREACEEVLSDLSPLFESVMLIGAIAGRDPEYMTLPGAGNEDLPYDEWLQKEAELEKQMGALTSALEKERKESARKDRKAQRSLQQLNEKLQRVDRELKQEKRAHKQLRQELTSTRGRAEGAEADFDARVAAGIEEGLGARLRDWLQAPRRVAAAVASLTESGRADDVLEQAAAALDKQAERDRNVGNLKQLRQRLSELESVAQEVLRARQDALNPIAELPQVEGALQREIQRIRGILGESAPLGLHVQALRAEINESDSPAALEALLQRLETLDELSVLPRRDLRELYAAYHAKMARMYDRFTTYLSERKQPASLSWLFKRSIDASEPFIWILDGHNVLFCLDDMFGTDPDTGAPGAAARDKLVAAMVQMGAEAPNSEIYVFFDSPKREERHVTPNVSVIYSGGGDGEQRADRAILEHLDVLGQQRHGVARVLVTDDRKLGDDARAVRTRVMRLAEFAAVLTDAVELT